MDSQQYIYSVHSIIMMLLLSLDKSIQVNIDYL
jgi:hypothetical protein